MRSQEKIDRVSASKNAGLWVLQIVTAAAFVLAGIAKLTGQPMMVETFEKVGLGQWFRYITAVIEIGSAAFLLIPRLTPVGAALLVCTMAGAVLSHLLVLGGSPVPALVLGCFAVIILWGRLPSVKSWLAGPTRSTDSAAKVYGYEGPTMPHAKETAI